MEVSSCGHYRDHFFPLDLLEINMYVLMISMFSLNLSWLHINLGQKFFLDTWLPGMKSHVDEFGHLRGHVCLTDTFLV